MAPPPRPEKIEQKRTRELTKVIQLSPNTAAGGFRAQTRRASFAGRPPTPRRRFWRAPAPRLNLRGGMVVQTQSAPNAPKDAQAWREPHATSAEKRNGKAHKPDSATDADANPSAHRAKELAPEPRPPAAEKQRDRKKAARLSGRGVGTLAPELLGDDWARERRRACRYTKRSSTRQS